MTYSEAIHFIAAFDAVEADPDAYLEEERRNWDDLQIAAKVVADTACVDMDWVIERDTFVGNETIEQLRAEYADYLMSEPLSQSDDSEDTESDSLIQPHDALSNLANALQKLGNFEATSPVQPSEASNEPETFLDAVKKAWGFSDTNSDRPSPVINLQSKFPARPDKSVSPSRMFLDRFVQYLESL